MGLWSWKGVFLFYRKYVVFTGIRALGQKLTQEKNSPFAVLASF